LFLRPSNWEGVDDDDDDEDDDDEERTGHGGNVSF